MYALLIATALAADPVVEKAGDGWIAGQIDIAAAPGGVYAVVSDPHAMADLDSNVTVLKATPDEECTRVEVHVKNPIASISYETRNCPVGELALEQKLVGGQLSEFDATWRVEATEGGSRVYYKVRSVPSFYVPQWMVDRATIKGAREILGALRDKTEA